MRTKLVVAVAGLALSLAVTAVSVSAHHAFAAEFDANKPLTMKGTVTKMEWTNPHVWVHMDVKKDDRVGPLQRELDRRLEEAELARRCRSASPRTR